MHPLYRKVFTCYFYLGRIEESKIIHSHIYELYDKLQERHFEIYGVADTTEKPEIQEDYENLSQSLTTNWNFSNLLQAKNAFRLNLIDKIEFEKVETRFLRRIEERNRKVENFSGPWHIL